MEIKRLEKTSTPEVKTKMVNFTLPLYVTVSDYHEFSELCFVIESLTGVKPECIELGCDGVYHGIIFSPEQKQELIDSKVFKKIKKTFEEEEKEEETN